MYLVLLQFKERWFWRVHWEMRFTSHWKVERSCWQDIGLKSNKTLAYIIRCESLENGRLGISFTYSKNKRGPKMDPWGTPDVTGNQDEQVSRQHLIRIILTNSWCISDPQ